MNDNTRLINNNKELEKDSLFSDTRFHSLKKSSKVLRKAKKKPNLKNQSLKKFSSKGKKTSNAKIT